MTRETSGFPLSGHVMTRVFASVATKPQATMVGLSTACR
jgi:hypothetical protein